MEEDLLAFLQYMFFDENNVEIDMKEHKEMA